MQKLPPKAAVERLLEYSVAMTGFKCLILNLCMYIDEQPEVELEYF